MKKLFSMIFMIMAAIALVACNGEGAELPVDEFPTFDADQEIQMSPEQMVVLLENISYEALMTETIRVHISGSMVMRQSSTYEDGYWDYETEEYVEYFYSQNNSVDLTIDADYYMLFSEMVENAKMVITGTIDLISMSSSNWNNELEEEEIIAVGSLNAYLYNQEFYLDPDMDVTENGVTTTHAFKQKLNQLFTQQMYDEMVDDLMMQLSFLSGQDPEAIGEMIDTEQLDDLLKTIPNLKVFQDGVVTTIVFEVNKQDIIDNAIDFILAAAKVVGEEAPPLSEIDEVRLQIESTINESVESFNFKYSISIIGQTITRIAIEIKALIDNEEVYLDIDMLYVISFGIELPEFPTDLDTYVPVEEFEMFD